LGGFILLVENTWKSKKELTETSHLLFEDTGGKATKNLQKPVIYYLKTQKENQEKTYRNQSSS
jgi:hypothetical protein